MNRRSFLHSAALAAAALVADPERLLWTPGKKTIFVPLELKLTSHLVKSVEVLYYAHYSQPDNCWNWSCYAKMLNRWG